MLLIISTRSFQYIIQKLSTFRITLCNEFTVSVLTWQFCILINLSVSKLLRNMRDNIISCILKLQSLKAIKSNFKVFATLK